MAFKYNIDYSNFTDEEMQAWARNMATQQGKTFIVHDIEKSKSIFKSTEGEIELEKSSLDFEEKKE